MAEPHFLESAGGRRGAAPAAGFTLIELLLVLVLIAMTSGLIALSMRDGDAHRLDQEAMRLAALLEAGRAASRASGVAVIFALGTADTMGGDDFRFVGLPPGTTLPTRWLNPGLAAQLAQGRAVALGPEPLIGAQRIVLRLGEQQLALVSDGLGPFVAESGAGP